MTDFELIDRIHEVQDATEPIAANNAVYEKLLPVFLKAAKYQARIGDTLSEIELTR